MSIGQLIFQQLDSFLRTLNKNDFLPLEEEKRKSTHSNLTLKILLFLHDEKNLINENFFSLWDKLVDPSKRFVIEFEGFRVRHATLSPVDLGRESEAIGRIVSFLLFVTNLSLKIRRTALKRFDLLDEFQSKSILRFRFAPLELLKEKAVEERRHC